MKTPRNFRQIARRGYPWRIEKSFERFTLAIVRKVHRRIREHLRDSLRRYRGAYREAVRTERKVERADAAEPTPELSAAIQEFIRTTLALSAVDFARDVLNDEKVRARLARFAMGLGTFGVARNREALGEILGPAIPQIAVSDIIGEPEIEAFIGENVDLITKLSQVEIDRMNRVVLKSVQTGIDPKDLAVIVEDSLGVAEARARLIARDQVAKFNSQVSQATQQRSGIMRYRWVTARDARVRERHSELDRKIFEWSDPPVVDERTGRREHPGGDYQCRCVAIPVFDDDE